MNPLTNPLVAYMILSVLGTLGFVWVMRQDAKSQR
tara:strand:+ start:810 stop:914 length:105 start_codon:yes stop_codon:yes gene_type:complete